MGIAGPVGQSFGIVEKNWICPKCGNSNYATGNFCHNCRERKPLGGGGLMMDTAMVRDQVGIFLFQIRTRPVKHLSGRRQLIRNQIFYITTIL